jgi:CrcB protein
MIGSFILVFFLTVILEYIQSTSYLVLAVSTGFVGAFTTFSSLSVEAVKIAQYSPVNSLLYICSSFVFGFILAFIGRLTGKVLIANLKRETESAEGADVCE